MDQPIGL